MGILFSIIVGFLIGCYLYYEFLKDGLLPRIIIFVSLAGILNFCFGFGFGNKINDLNLLNGITIFICALSLEENTVFFIRKLKAYIKTKKEGKNRDVRE